MSAFFKKSLSLLFGQHVDKLFNLMSEGESFQVIIQVPFAWDRLNTTEKRNHPFGVGLEKRDLTSLPFSLLLWQWTSLRSLLFGNALAASTATAAAAIAATSLSSSPIDR